MRKVPVYDVIQDRLGWNGQNLKIILKICLWFLTHNFLSFAFIQFTYHSASVQASSFLILVFW